MNPYLEAPEFWSAVHNRLIVAIADDLVDRISEKYRIEIEKRTYFSNEEVNERYLEIREVATGTVVTTIELLSPKNKRPGEGRIAYQRQRNQVLASITHLVEIDLLRGGKPLAIASPNLGDYLGDYRILICRGDRRPTGDLYAFTLRQSIPPVPIPLAPGEVEPLLELQPLLDRVYAKGRYALAIDYTLPPQPPFSPEDRQWVETLLLG